MNELDQIENVFRFLIHHDNIKLSIFVLDEMLGCVSTLIRKEVKNTNELINVDAVLGIGSKEFVLHYQPIVRLSDRKIVGHEGLIRWNHPYEGFLSPEYFLDKLSSASLLLLTLEVARMACEKLQTLDERLWLAINLSAYDIQNRGFLSRFNKVVDANNIDRSRLRLEITENTILDQPWMFQILESLSIQHTIEMDDFGTGQASLGAIASYPISVIKVDKSLLDGIPGNLAKERVFRAIISMADNLGYEVIAEGVETLDQSNWLQYNGCGYGQGWLFGKAEAL